jgi:carboxypeptidase D
MRNRFFAAILSFIFAVTLACAMASAADDARPGPVYVLNITAPNETALHGLVESGYDVASVHGLIATIYATPVERGELLALGWPVTYVDQTAGLEKTLGVYHTYDSLTTELQDYAALHPGICRMQSLGKSLQGRDLWAMLITDNPDIDEDEPESKFIGSIHGDEPVGMELCLYLIDLLLNQYATDERIAALVDETALWIVPLMNPDGLNSDSRYNAQGYDLNRKFPDYPVDYSGTIFNTPLDVSGLPIEIAHVMNWTAEESFTIAANFHGGALLVNYPYDHEPGIPSGQPAPSPDEDLFQYISRAYSVHNTPMWNNNTGDIENGIINGSDWYAITGSMQDWDYRFAGCNHVTIELSNIKRPAASALAQLWEDNRESMLAYLDSAHIGIRGIVTDADTGAPVYARIFVNGNTQPVFTDPDLGDYHRMLLPGAYTLTISATGYLTRTIENVFVAGGPAVVVDAQMEAPATPVSPIYRLILMLLLAIFGLRLLFGKSAQQASLPLMLLFLSPPYCE